MRRLAAGGLDVELADRLMGLASVVAMVVRRWSSRSVRDGQVVRRKYRFFDREEGKWTADKGGQRIAFNEDCLRDEADPQPLIITEGEFDAMAAIQCGFARTISVPDGAPPPGERSREDLEAGAKYDWLKDIKPFLTPERVRGHHRRRRRRERRGAAAGPVGAARPVPVQVPDLPEGAAGGPRAARPHRCKDLNEVLQFYGSKGVVETISRAQWIQVDGVYRMSDLPPLPAPQVFDIGFRLLGENYKMRLGDFVVITGVPGLGKSTFANDLCCRVA
jgi:twinkle protein